jgi:transcriptional regulator with XRE-family HTH domain
MAKRLGRPPGLTPDGPKIKRLRVGHGWTTPQLAAQIGRHPESVRRAEGGRPISDVFASRLARALGVSMSDITDWDDGDGIESEPEPKVPAA